MARKSDRRRRWASLSALASAALAASSGTGEAAIIYHPTRGFSSPGSLPLPRGQSISLVSSHTGFRDADNTFNSRRREASGFVFSSTQVRARGVEFDNPIAVRRYYYRHIGGTIIFRSGSGKGVTRPFTGSSASRFVEHVLGRRYTTTGEGQKLTSVSFSAYQRRTTDSPSSYSNEYVLFSFNVGPQTDYGWLELSVYYNPNPVVDVLGYAYDTSGRPIAAGAIPEPKHLPLALGALALGSIGVREWRKKRNAIA